MEIIESLDKMLEIRTKADEIFERENLSQNGFGKCPLFGSILKQFDLMLIGLNPGGSITEEVKIPEEEIEIFTKNPTQNDFLDKQYENDKLISGLRKFYYHSFGEFDFENKLKTTFWWNLCLARNTTNFGGLDKKIQGGAFDAYWELTKEVINIVKPKIILTFIASYNFIKQKLEIKNDIDFIVPNPLTQNYYYMLEDVNFETHVVKKVIGIHHLSTTHFNETDWVRFGEAFRNDYNEVTKN